MNTSPCAYSRCGLKRGFPRKVELWKYVLRFLMIRLGRAGTKYAPVHYSFFSFAQPRTGPRNTWAARTSWRDIATVFGECGSSAGSANLKETHPVCGALHGANQWQHLICIYLFIYLLKHFSAMNTQVITRLWKLLRNFCATRNRELPRQALLASSFIRKCHHGLSFGI